MRKLNQSLLDLREKRAGILSDKGELRSIALEEVKMHCTKESGWIIVDGYVYDITSHVINHAGWTCGCAVSTLGAILRTLGTDCTDEVFASHSDFALESIQYFMIGVEALQ
jgi:nitrate reductase (NAD(P)H)